MKALTYSVIVAALLLCACDDKITGPDATINQQVSPNVACNASDMENTNLQTRVVLMADGDAGAFSPLPINVVAGDAGIALPTITLTSADGGAPITVNQAQFVSNTEMDLWVTRTTNGGNPIPAGTYTVTVTNPDGTTASAMGALRVTLPPVLTSAARITPPVPNPPADPNESRTVCNATNTVVALTGANFRPADPKPIVQLVDNTGALFGMPFDPSNVTVVSTTEIDVTFVAPTDPSMRIPPGQYGFRITNPDGTQTVGYPEGCHITRENLITVVPPPVITSIQPVSVCSDQMAMFTVSGMNFRPGASVTFQTSPAVAINTVTVNAAGTSIMVSVPANMLAVGGPYGISVANADGCAATLAPACPPGATPVSGQMNVCMNAMGTGPEALTVYASPTVTAISPMNVCGGGAMVMITGTGFHATYGTQPTVTIQGMNLTNVMVVNSTTITATLPTLPTGGPYTVTVTLPEGCSGTSTMAMGEVTVAPGPTVAAIIPSQGWNGIDFPITIIGTGFMGVIDVKLVDPATGTVVATMTAAAPGLLTVDTSQTQISAYVPMGTMAGGPYDVVVDTASCSVTLPRAFTVNNMPSFDITAVIPPFGWTGTTTPVTITAAMRTGGTTLLESTPRAYLVIPSATPRLQPLRGDVFVSTTSMTAVVPMGFPVGGPYDLVVINPDGTAGVLTSAFRVVAMPIPTINSIVPQEGTTNGGAFTVNGANFRSSTVQLLPVTPGSTTPPSCNPASTSTLPSGTINSGGTQITTTYPANLVTQSYVVCVTDPDEMTYGEYGVFTITNPSSKLGTWCPSTGTTCVAPPALPDPMGRRGLGATFGRVNGANQFVYAVAGDDRTTALNTVEFSQLDIVGNLGAWTTQRYTLQTPRTRTSVVTQGPATGGGCIYAIGGSGGASGSAAAMAAANPTPTAANVIATGSVERACILTFADAPVVNDPTVAPQTTGTAGLARGAWLYRVAAVKCMTDSQNPGGETLPSDETTAFLAERSNVTLSWAAVSGACGYRVYRSPMVNGTSGSETRLFPQQLTDPPLTATMYTDDGSLTPVAATVQSTPIHVGSTGVWVAQTDLVRSRDGTSAAIAADPGGALFVYALGGAGACTAGGTFGAMDCYEYASISQDGVTLGSWTAGTNAISSAHWAGAAGVANTVTVPGFTAGAIVYDFFGYSSLTTTSPDISSAAVMTGGVLGTFSTSTHMNITAGGLGGAIINGAMYRIGGNTGAPGGAADVSAEFGTIDATGVVSAMFSNQSPLPTAKAFYGLVDVGAYFVAIGGTSSGTDATTSVYQIQH